LDGKCIRNETDEKDKIVNFDKGIERNHVGDQSVNERMILKWTAKIGYK
jgi:hypothetical protein